MQNPLSWLLEESEEDIRRDIDEAKEIIKEREKALKEIKTKKKKTSKKSNNNYLLGIIAIIGVILVIIFFYYQYSGASSIPKESTNQEMEPFKYICNEKNDCEDCEVVASCVQFEELFSEEDGPTDYIHFEVENKRNVSGECTAEIVMEMDGEILMEKKLSLGTINAQESKRFKLLATMPEGESHVTVDPSCEW